MIDCDHQSPWVVQKLASLISIATYQSAFIEFMMMC